MHHVSPALLGSHRIHGTLLVPAAVTAREIVHYLLDGGLLAHSAVVAGDVIVVEDARRHFNYTVLPDLFVKRIQSGQPHAVATLHKEASCYALIHGDPALAEIDRHMPRLVAYDPQAHVLVTRRIDARRNARIDPRLLGETLARIHDVSRRALIGKIESAIFVGDPPWILSLHRYGAIEHAGEATKQFIGILRANPRIGEQLDALRANWRRDVLMHGDIKFDNVLVAGDDLVLVDWEMVDIGDAAWDVASVLQGYLSVWIAQLGSSTDGTIEERVSIETIQPAMRAFWEAYGGADLERVAAYTGARLLQHAYESVAVAPALTPHALWQMQAAVNVLDAPMKAAADLLGLA